MAKDLNLDVFDDTVKNYDLSGFDQSAPTSDVGALGAAGLGAVKGVTLGFDDEIAGAAKAIFDKVGGQSKEDFWDIYKKVRDSVRTTHEQAEEAHPYASLGGELAGGLLLPVPGLGAVGSGAGFLAKAGAMAKTGAKVGAIAGLGTSEADLTKGDVGGAIKDVGSSAVLGGVAGAGLQALGTGLSTGATELGKIAKSFPITQELIDQFNIHKGGGELLGKFPQLSEKSSKIAEGAIDKIRETKLLMGQFMNASKEALDEQGFKINIKDKVAEARAAINQLKPVGKEAADVEELKAILGNMVDEVEKPYFIKAPSAKAPKMQNVDKAERTVAKKTAEAEAKDLIKRQEVQAALDDALLNGTDEEVAGLQAMLAKLENNTEYPPQNILDETTGLPALGVSRGLGKAPIAEGILPELPATTETFYQPLEQRLQTIQQRPSVSVQELDTEIKRLNDFIKTSNTQSTKDAARSLITKLEQQRDVASSTNPQVADILKQYQEAKKQYGTISKAQGQLGIKKGAYGATEEAKRVQDIEKLKALMDKLQSPGSKGARSLEKGLTTLEQAAPNTATDLRKTMADASRQEYLSGETTAEGGLSKSLGTFFASAKAIPLLSARAAGKAMGAAENTVSGPSKQLLGLGNRLYDASPDTLKQLADRAATQGKHFAPILNKIVNAPLNKRKALLFTLMQQPEFREFAQTLSSNEEEL